MHTVFHSDLLVSQHQELLDQRDNDRRVAFVCRQRKAMRLRRRSASLAARAVALVDETSR